MDLQVEPPLTRMTWSRTRCSCRGNISRQQHGHACSECLVQLAPTQTTQDGDAPGQQLSDTLPYMLEGGEREAKRLHPQRHVGLGLQGSASLSPSSRLVHTIGRRVNRGGFLYMHAHCMIASRHKALRKLMVTIQETLTL